MSISIEQATAIAESAAKKAVAEALSALGVDLDKPLETQQDFAHLRKHRLASDDVGKYTKIALIGVVVSGAVTTLLIGLKSYFSH